MKHAQIIDSWPEVDGKTRLRVFADDIGVAPGTAKAMRMRGRIPEQYWLLVEDAGIRREIPGVSLVNLAIGAADIAGVEVPKRYRSA